MATYSTGIAATFGGQPLTELVGLSWNFGNGMPSGRGVAFTPIGGQVTIETLAGAPTLMWGVRDVLVIAGGGVGLTTPAVCTDIAATAELNGVARYSITFDILDN